MADLLGPHAFGRAVMDRPPAPLPFPPGSDAAAHAPFSIQTIGVDAPGNAPSTDDDGTGDYVVVTMTTAVDGTVVPTTMPDSFPPPPPPPPPSRPRPRPPPDSVDETMDDTVAADHADGHVVVANGECRLMGPFAIFVQLGLGSLALLSLVFKRWRERPQRPLKIWFFDASKQVFGSVLVHMSNVFLSLLTSGRFSFKLEPGVVASSSGALLRLIRRDDGEEPYLPNPCSFYLLNLAIDTTIGIPILIGLVRLTTAIVAHTPLGKPRESIQSGNYGHPPSAWWWFKQSILYFCGLFGMKICVLIIFLVFPWISRVGDWALGWTEGNEQLQIVFVMMLFPLIMNAMQYYIIDGFIKEQPVHDGGHHHHHDGRYDVLSDSADDEDDGSARPPLHRRFRRDDGGADGDDESSSGDQREEEDDEELDMLGDVDDVAGGKRAAVTVAVAPIVVTTTTTVIHSTKHEHVTSSASSATGTATIRGADNNDDVDYDPRVDGETRTVIGSSASQRQILDATAAKEP
ncbi:fk506-binding protein [Grosmannia clavigera kw1407]|uniref:Fk506-binding protein n=1 Tax=Grosmannia clavigera (strain kw1407 / UAMH 11150) TaxID=655863 RepID=F0XKM9_GROCL|nr:fk506-binding protein [Grosmannia clavigera kw1407]EFX01731.1 fk506-binding protein [Grosmannia clavigera kw1407]